MIVYSVSYEKKGLFGTIRSKKAGHVLAWNRQMAYHRAHRLIARKGIECAAFSIQPIMAWG